MSTVCEEIQRLKEQNKRLREENEKLRNKGKHERKINECDVKAPKSVRRI
jgi:hypothetical protein